MKKIPHFNGEIEHIGSTAIPNTIGKGIIDILISCTSPNEQNKMLEALRETGYVQGEMNKIPDGRLFLFRSRNGKTQAGDFHLHLVVRGKVKEPSILFRNFLLQNPREVQEYNKEKERLAAVSQNDRHTYAVQKEKYILHVMRLILQKSNFTE